MIPFNITSATTEQEVFEAIVRHAAQMPSKSLAEHPKAVTGMCAYRTGENACFIGALLTDEEAAQFDALTMRSLSMDGNSNGGGVSTLISENRFPDRLMPFSDLLMDLQPVHDEYGPEYWPVKLREIAQERALNDAIIDEVFNKD